MNNLESDQVEFKSYYDYIVVGSGSAGSIVAAKLSANPNTTVLLLEAGKSALSVPDVWDPNDINCLYNDPSIHWGYKTTPQVHMKNRELDYYRAKMTGGCTSHNDMVYTRGAPADFDQWEGKYGCTGWDYNSIVRNFESVEAMLQPTKSIENTFSIDFTNACEALGIPNNPNYNSGQNMFGVSPLQSTINSENTRVTSFQNYITPNLDRPNLDVVLYCNVEKVTFDESNQVTGIVVHYGGTKQTIGVNKEVILSAGAINSPAILMRSGIGDAAELRRLDSKKIISDLPGVGQNLMEAIIFKGTWSTKEPIYDQPRNEGFRMTWANMNEAEQASNCIEMMRGTYECDESQETLEYNYSITGGAMRLKSLGSVTLESLAYDSNPIINLNLYADPNDMEQALAAFELMRAIGNSPQLDSIRKEEKVPGPSVNTPEEIHKWLLDNSWPYSHASCTCKMGTGPDAVLDPDLKVKGVSGLRVADTSIMPVITSGHTQGPALMIGDKAADLILNL
jgi:choline dehydrogenase